MIDEMQVIANSWISYWGITGEFLKIAVTKIMVEVLSGNSAKEIGLNMVAFFLYGLSFMSILKVGNIIQKVSKAAPTQAVKKVVR